MPPRRVDLQLPDMPSDGLLRLAEAIKQRLAPQYAVKIFLAGEREDSDRTPVDFRPHEPQLIALLEEVGPVETS